MVKRYTSNSLLFFVAMVLIMGGISCKAKESAESEPAPKEEVKVAKPAEEAKEVSEVETPQAEEKAEKPQVIPPPVGEKKQAPEVEVKPAEKANDVLKIVTPPAEILLLSSLWKTHTKGAVRFPHEKHFKEQKIKCEECHHVYENGNNVWEQKLPVKKCEVCHDEPTVKEENKLSDDAQKKNLKLAFHNRCQGCHRKLKKENPETKAPTVCTKCHEKNT